MKLKKIIKIFLISAFAAMVSYNQVIAGVDNESLKTKYKSQIDTNDCFEGTSRAIFSFNQGLDKIFFKPVAKGYRILPSPVRKGTNNFVSNIKSSS